MSDHTLTALAEIAFFIAVLMVGVWFQMGRKPIVIRVIGVLLSIIAFGFGMVSAVVLLDILRR